MNKDKRVLSLFILSISGLIFSGYMSSVKFFTSNCVFNEPCPIFLGLPACYFGFGMFIALFILTTAMLLGNISLKKGIKAVLLVSSIGIIFAGYFTIKEIPVLITSGLNAYILGLPTCAIGLIFYILIYIIGFSMLKKLKIKTKPH